MTACSTYVRTYVCTQVEDTLVTDFNYVAGVTAVFANQLQEVCVCDARTLALALDKATTWDSATVKHNTCLSNHYNYELT